ncbi:hypothetical protein AVEN_209433-1, partial [Araneus ventricosus]
MDTSKVCPMPANDVVITIEEATDTTTLTNSSTETEDTPTEIPQCQQILRTATPQRAWGLVYANYH